jgi:hypothetical protein
VNSTRYLPPDRCEVRHLHGALEYWRDAERHARRALACASDSDDDAMLRERARAHARFAAQKVGRYSFGLAALLAAALRKVAAKRGALQKLVTHTACTAFRAPEVAASSPLDRLAASLEAHAPPCCAA